MIETSGHVPECPCAETGTCCPWIENCDCQCVCDFARQVADRVLHVVRERVLALCDCYPFNESHDGYCSVSHEVMLVIDQELKRHGLVAVPVDPIVHINLGVIP